MEKNKNRTDLLAAGRKKLQQYRQKKDNKGNNSKSSSKGGKSGHDTTSDTVSEATVTPQNDLDGELSKHEMFNLSESSSGVDAAANDATGSTSEHDATVGASNDTSAAQQHEADGDRFKPDAEDTTALPESNFRVDTVASGTSEEALTQQPIKGGDKCNHDAVSEAASGVDSVASVSDLANDKPSPKGAVGIAYLLEDAEVPAERSGMENTSDGHDVDIRVAQEDGSSSLGPEETTNNVSAMVSEERSGDSSLLIPSEFSSGLGKEHGEEQEVGRSSGNQIDDRTVTLGDGDSNLHSDDTGKSTGDSMGADSGNTFAEDNIYVVAQLSEIGNVSSTVSVVNYAGEGEVASDSVVASPSIESSMVSAVRSVATGQERDGTSFGSNEEKTEVVNVSDTKGSGFVEIERSFEIENNDNAKFLACKEIDLSPILDGSVTKLSQLAEILQILDEDDIRYLFKSRELSLVEIQEKDETFAKEIVQSRNALQEVFSERAELDKQLQLSKPEVEVFTAKVNELQSKLEMTQGEMSSTFSELVDCRNLVQALQSENETLKESFKVISEENNKLSQESGIFLASLSEERKKLGDEKVIADHQIGQISEELIHCKDFIGTLQTEIVNLNERITSISEEKETIFHEYEMQYTELVQFKVLEEVLQAECCNAVINIKEAKTCIKHLTEEHKSLCADLEFHKFKLRELSYEKNSTQFDEAATHVVENYSGMLHEPKSEFSSREHNKLGVYDDSHGFLAIKRNLEEAGIAFQKLERELENIHLECSLSGSQDAPGVSRTSQLIQAFEAKGDAERDDHDPEKPPSFEDQRAEDSYARTKMVIKNLKVLLKELMNTEDASEFCRVIESKLPANAAGTDWINYDTLKEHNDQVQEANIELMVLYEALREVSHHAVAKESELICLCEAMQKQEAILISENCHIRQKMNGFLAQINELQNHLEVHSRDSDEMAAFISNQLQALQVEVADRELIVQEEWSSASAQILQNVSMLNSTTKNISTNSLPSGNINHDVVGSVNASVDGACKVITDLHKKLEAAQRDFQEMCRKNDVALIILQTLYNELSELVRVSFGDLPDAAENAVAEDKMLDLLHPTLFNTLLDQLKKLSSERLELDSLNKQLSSQLITTALETDERQKLCLKPDTVLKLIDDVEQLVRLEGMTNHNHEDEPAPLLESLIHLLVQKYRETQLSLSFSQKDREPDQILGLCASLETQVHDLQSQVDHLNFVLVELENENLVFKHSLRSAQEAVSTLNSRVQEKVAELELSEHRVSSLREKLSIAVTKGKGLISQRDSLKQSLADMSKELEKCSQELLSKDATLQELETKVKVYSEAGERMEALESELSYIRNSATALRESFLLKDSVLQRIEEILEDLELPEHLHSRDIIEKIDWLAKLVGSHSLPLGEWDHRSSGGEGSSSDAGFVGMDGLKEDMQPNPTSSEDLRRRYEDLQNRFYGLAEQNEMLEQSLMERNNLVQQWEEILDRVDLPPQLRSMEPEDKIQWLGSALSETQNNSYSLQQKIDNLESLCGSLNADIEDSQRIITELEAAFVQACTEKEILLKDLEILRQDNDESTKRIAEFTLRNDNLKKEASMLQEDKLRLEEDKDSLQDVIRRLKNMVKDTLQDSSLEDAVLGQEGIEYFEEILVKLVEKHETLLSGKGELSGDSEEQDVVTLSKKLEDSIGELMSLKEEKDKCMLTNQSLAHELEELELKRKELEELLSNEEHKSASLREKLNVAVRKGKSLVQQRDGQKKEIEELNAEVERLKTETLHSEKTIHEYEEQIKNLFAARDRVQVVESENTFLRDRLAETEHYLLEKEGNWSSILTALAEIDAGLEISSGNPVERIKEIGKYLHDLGGRMDSLEQESGKSKRAAELLLAELNEVQERNDGLQDDLTKVFHELSVVSREKDVAENAKHETLAHVDKLSYLHMEEKERLMSEIMVLKSGVDNMRIALSAVERELEDVLSKDLEVMYNMKVVMESFSDLDGSPALGALFPGNFPSDKLSEESENKVFLAQINSIRERIREHSHLLQEETSRLYEVVMNVCRDYTSQKEVYESVKRDAEMLQSMDKEKESELHILQGNIRLLIESCSSAISRLENSKEDVGRAMVSRSPDKNLNSLNQIGGNISSGDACILNEESIRSMCDKLSVAVGDSISMHANELARVMEVGQSEMKSTLANLQKQLQEKDIQRDRISKELVDQIREAESNAKNHLLDLQQARLQLHDSQRQLDLMAEERKLLEQRMKEFQDKETNAIDLQQKVNSLTDALAAKVQESEALMQALDEEEAEMENLANKITGLENELHQKNKDLENLEASRAKALKKLSVTVSKFDEVHNLSENLLSEVEKLQSQLQEKDGEISFLRQEVTRCTNDALAVTQMSKKRNMDEIQDLLAWFDSLTSRTQVNDVAFDYSKSHLVDEYKEVLQKKILELISELENLRVTNQNRNMLLQEERIKVEELTQTEGNLKNSLREMESQLAALQGVGDSTKAAKSTSEIVEVEPMTNKWASSGSIAPQVRSLRKQNNDQVSIAIDTDDSSQMLDDDDDDDKAHGFKSLTTSRIVPRFTRPISDMVDGLWMSCDRALMRQPALRLAVIIYWALVHTMLATFVV